MAMLSFSIISTTATTRRILMTLRQQFEKGSSCCRNTTKNFASICRIIYRINMFSLKRRNFREHHQCKQSEVKARDVGWRWRC